MKLLTHNMLQCHVKGVRNGFPLAIAASDAGALEVEVREADLDADFLRHIVPRLDWGALVTAAGQVRSHSRATHARGRDCGGRLRGKGATHPGGARRVPLGGAARSAQRAAAGAAALSVSNGC